MAEKFGMNYAELLQAVEGMNTEGQKMEDSLNAAANELTSCISNSWKSEAGETVSEKMEQLQKTFESFKTEVNTLAKFVSDAAATVAAQDADIAAAATNLTSTFTGSEGGAGTTVQTVGGATPQ